MIGWIARYFPEFIAFLAGGSAVVLLLFQQYGAAGIALAITLVAEGLNWWIEVRKRKRERAASEHARKIEREERRAALKERYSDWEPGDPRPRDPGG